MTRCATVLVSHLRSERVMHFLPLVDLPRHRLQLVRRLLFVRFDLLLLVVARLLQLQSATSRRVSDVMHSV